MSAKEGWRLVSGVGLSRCKNRAYTQILPNADRSKPFTLHENCPVYLVTHDQIAVAFALSNGINVIYMNYHGLIYVFKNMADPAFLVLENASKKYYLMVLKKLD